jgi:hypothetical protein
MLLAPGRTIQKRTPQMDAVVKDYPALVVQVFNKRLQIPVPVVKAHHIAFLSYLALQLG